jgi:hypothetical protein
VAQPIRCGLSPNAVQMSCTAVCVSPTSRAIDRVDQCVASRGVLSSVSTITSSTWNENPQPYVWTKTADQILESITRYCTRTNLTGH